MFYRILFSVLIISLCWIFRDFLERSPVTHMLFQLPLLAWAGYLIVPKGALATSSMNQGGWAALLVVLFTTAIWMLPRSIDAAVTSPTIDLIKFITIPIGFGAALAIGWPNAHPILRGFIKAQTLSMLLVLAFLYTHSPVRICNAYLVNDQERLGYGFLIAAILLAIIWVFPLFFAENSNRSNTNTFPLRLSSSDQNVSLL